MFNYTINYHFTQLINFKLNFDFTNESKLKDPYQY